VKNRPNERKDASDVYIFCVI